MNCKECNKCDLSKIFHSNCVQDALDTIGQHFLFLRKQLEDKSNEMKLYAEHNERLTKVVTFLQREKKECGKRRKKNNYGEYSPKLWNVESDCSAENKRDKAVCTDTTSPTPASNLDLNLALNSEQLQDLSDISSTQETIAETEKINSTLKNSLLSARRTLLREVNGEDQKKANTNSTNRFAGFIGKQNDSALMRSRQSLKQTKLHFNVKSGENNTDVIEASPNLYSSIQQTKFRSFCQRSVTGFGSDETPKKLHTKHKSPTKTVFNDNPDANISENFFDFSKTKFNTPTSLLSSPTTSKSKLPPDSSQSSSVLLLTPMTQDIVFVDDSQESDCSLDSMKHFEEKIDKKSAKTLQNKIKSDLECESDSTKPMETPKSVLDVVIKKEPITQNLDETRLEEDQFTEVHKYNVSKGYNLYYQQSHKRKLYEEEQSDDDDFVQPIIVKRESDIPKKKLSIKKRFPICCDDCEKYLTFFGENLSDRQIEDHLHNCKRRKEQERLGHTTPPGFWNPLMESFPDGDPRNEVLVHRLFKQKNDNS